jgi:hypothetical protein
MTNKHVKEKLMEKIISLIVMLGLYHTAFAIQPGSWQCTSFDSHKQIFKAQSLTLQRALYAAKRKCQKESHYGACKTAQSFCQQGPLSLVDDRCVASDDSGWAWNTTGINACKTALSLCNQWAFKNGTALGTNCIVRHR